MKLMPMVGGAILLFVVIFSLYVRSVPSTAVPRVKNFSDLPPVFNSTVIDTTSDANSQGPQGSNPTMEGSSSVSEDTMEL